MSFHFKESDGADGTAIFIRNKGEPWIIFRALFKEGNWHKKLSTVTNLIHLYIKFGFSAAFAGSFQALRILKKLKIA